MSDHPTRVEELVTSIVHKNKLVKECAEQEKRTASERNGYDCEASNAVNALAKELVVALGSARALALTKELASITSWEPPVMVPVEAQR